MILAILGSAAAVGIGGFLLWERHDMAKVCIEADLRRVRATEIRISPDWFDFDRDTLSYDVEYTDASGRRQINQCKVNAKAGGDDRPYWASPL